MPKRYPCYFIAALIQIKKISRCRLRFTPPARGDSSSLASIALLLKAGARLESRNSESMTPAMVCALYSNLAGLAFLVGRGARTNVRDPNKLGLSEILTKVLARAHGRKFAQQREEIRIMFDFIASLN
jgi:hypothetical protein